jgi:CheY-like chemotaxis protein
METSGVAPLGESAAAAKPLRVLVVEDLQDARETLQELLELLGHEVETAADGRSGLAKLHSMRPDVALIDIGLPGLDGYEVASRYRAEAPDAPVRLVALTGYGQPEDRARARDAGFEAHVVKPIDPESLKQLLCNIPTS